MSTENFEGASKRGPSLAAMQKAAEHKDMMLGTFPEQYREVQMELAGLELDVKRGIEHMQTLADETMITRSKEIGKGLLEKIVKLEGKKGEIEQEIVRRGGDPKQYTVQ